MSLRLTYEPGPRHGVAMGTSGECFYCGLAFCTGVGSLWATLFLRSAQHLVLYWGACVHVWELTCVCILTIAKHETEPKQHTVCLLCEASISVQVQQLTSEREICEYDNSRF